MIGQSSTSSQLATSGLGICIELFITQSDPRIFTRTHVPSRSAVPTQPAPVTDNVCSFTCDRSIVLFGTTAELLPYIDSRFPTMPTVCSFTSVKST